MQPRGLVSTTLLALLAALALVGCQTTGEKLAADALPGHRPAITSDEAGLWLQSDRVEQEVGRSGRVIDDPQLNAYLRSIVCRISAQYCNEIRVQVVRAPGFNASMSPNGHMLVWSGMLLRAENEAQLAYVLGHELSHYLRRHSIKRWRELRNSTDAAAVFQLITLGAGVGFIGQLGQLVAVSSAYGFSREQENEADKLGFDLIAAAGYDTAQAPKIWQGLLEEKKAQKKPEQSVFFASHPSTEDRFAALSAHAQRTNVTGKNPIIGAKRHQQAIRAHRLEWFDDELTKREFGAILVVLERLAKGSTDHADAYFTRGEVYRLRRNEGDDSLALAAYAQALAAGDPPAALHRSMAMVRWRNGNHAGARESFKRYLQAQPQAGDATMIQSYINKLEQQ